MVEEPNPNQTKVSEKINLKDLGSLRAKIQAQKEAAKIEADQEAKVVIDLEHFNKVWTSYALYAQEKGRASLKLLMDYANPRIVGDNSFAIQVSNDTLKQTFLAEKNLILDQFFAELGTRKVEISVEIVEVEEKDKPRFLASPKDKYNHLVEINPELKNLMDDLGLEFNY